MYMYECVNVLCGLPIAHVLSSSSEGRNASDYKIKCHNEAWKERQWENPDIIMCMRLLK